MRHATLKQLRALAAVAKHGSVTAAARSLNLSAPAVTLQLQLLEQHAKIPLVQRVASGMEVTRAGAEVVDSVGHIEAALRDCEVTLAALAGAERGGINVGVISTAKYFAPRSLSAFASKHPGLELDLIVGNRSEIIQGLRQHKIDVAIMGSPPDELAVNAEIIGNHPHVIIANPAHHLAGQKKISPALLKKEKFLVREPGSGTRILMEGFFARTRLSPRISMQISSNETIKQAVIAGLGISFLSAHTIEVELEAKRMVILDIVGLPVVRQWHVVHASDRTLSPAVRLLCDFFVLEGKTYLPSLSSGFRNSGGEAKSVEDSV